MARKGRVVAKLAPELIYWTVINPGTRKRTAGSAENSIRSQGTERNDLDGMAAGCGIIGADARPYWREHREQGGQTNRDMMAFLEAPPRACGPHSA
jgi:hypothetical protein